MEEIIDGMSCHFAAHFKDVQTSSVGPSTKMLDTVSFLKPHSRYINKRINRVKSWIIAKVTCITFTQCASH